MSELPKYFDNINEKVVDELRQRLKPDSRISIAAASFSIFAFEALKEELSKVEELRFIFTSPTFTKEKAKKQKREFYISKLGRERTLYGSDFEIRLRNQLTQKVIARECADWIRRKVKFKANVTDSVVNPVLSVTDGDATFTIPQFNEFTTTELGCERGNTLNNIKIGLPGTIHTDQFLRQFSELWRDNDTFKDVTEIVIENIENVYRENSPDFAYDDDFSQSASDYAGASGDVDELGNRYRKNTDFNGRFHSYWCSMLYPRLQLARNLLKEDGVIFISIDDREICNLTKMCDDIFGNSNFICQFTWKSKLGKVGTTSTIFAVHEYILCYAKDSSSLIFEMIVKQSEGRKENLRQWGVADRREDRPSMWYPITINGITVYPYKEDGTEGRWRVGEEMAKELLASNSLILSNKDGKYNIYRIFPESESISAYTTLLLDDIGTTAKGAIALKELGLNKIFDFSKPIGLIKHFIFLSKDKQGLYLDFFSGSAPTAHAVMQLNAEDGGERRFIMVQLPEVTEEDSEARKAGYANICEIGKERIRRAGKKIKEGMEAGLQSGDKNSLFDDATGTKAPSPLDIGFRVFRVDDSNMEDVYFQPKAYSQDKLDLILDNIKADRTDLDLLFGAMLDWGVQLSLPMSKESVAECDVYLVNEGDLVACFSENISEEVIEFIAEQSPLRVLLRDSCFSSDADKINIFEQFKQRLGWSDEEAYKNIRVI